MLITWWVGEVWEKLQHPKYDKLRMSCWQKTGRLVTAYGADDHLVKQEGIPNYSVRPLFLLDPADQLPASNNPPAGVPKVSHEIVQTLEDQTELLDENEEIHEDKESIFEILDTLLLA